MQYADMSEDSPIPAQVKALREKAGLSVRAISELMGMPKSTYVHYETATRFKDRYLPVEFAESFAAAVGPRGVGRGEVMALTGLATLGAPVEVPNGQPAPNGTRLVPIYDVAASAGHGAIVDAEDHISNLAFGVRYLREMTSAGSRDLAAIRVKGESMEPTLLDDDMVLIDLTKKSLDYDGLFVLRYGEALQVKRIGRGSKRDTVMVIADNSRYPPVEVDRRELDVIGKVLWYGRKV